VYRKYERRKKSTNQGNKSSASRLNRVSKENAPTDADIQWAVNKYKLWEAEQDLLFVKDAWTAKRTKDGDVIITAK
jgi:hypothetical protein